MTIKRGFAALFCAIAVLCGASTSGEAATKWWLHSKPLLNRPSLGGLGTPGRGLDVALGLADFVAGRTSTAPLNVLLADGMAIDAFAKDTIQVPTSIASNTATITFHYDTSLYPGGFSTGAATDALTGLALPNVARSYVRIMDSTTGACSLLTSGSAAGTVNCANTATYVGGVVTAWDPIGGSITIQPTERNGSGTILPGNSRLVRHYPEYAAGETTGAVLTTSSSNTPTFRGTAGLTTYVSDWDFRSYAGNPGRALVDVDSAAANGLIVFTQCKVDWASNLYSNAVGIFGGSLQPYSVDHTDVEWTPFRDAFVATVAADTAAGGNQITINEAVPGYVSQMVADITTSGAVGGTIPFNGRTTTLSMLAWGANTGGTLHGGLNRQFWHIFDAKNPDALFNTGIIAVNGKTLTLDTQLDNDAIGKPSYPAIRSALKAGDKLYIYHGDLTADLATGPMLNFTFNRATSLLDGFYRITTPAGFGEAKWSYNILSQIWGNAPNQHQDLLQMGATTGATRISITHNVVQNVHLVGMQMGGNPREDIQTNNLYYWSSSLEFAYNIIDESGANTYAFYVQDPGPAPVQGVYADQENNRVRVSVNTPGLGYALTNGHLVKTDNSPGPTRSGDLIMLGGLPPSLAALSNRKAVVEKVYMGSSYGSTPYAYSRDSDGFSQTLAAGSGTVNQSGQTTLTLVSAAGMGAVGMPVTISGKRADGTTATATTTTIASYVDATHVTVADNLADSYLSGTISAPASVTLAGTSASSVAAPWVGYTVASTAAPTTAATSDDATSVANASKVCVSDASAIGQDMMLYLPGQTVYSPTASATYATGYPLFVTGKSANCVFLSGPVNSKSVAYPGTVYFVSWTKPPEQALVSIHDLYMKMPTFSWDPAATGFSARGPTGASLFYDGFNYAVRRPLSVYNIFKIADTQGDYTNISPFGTYPASIDTTKPMLNPARFAQFQNDWPQFVPVEAPYLTAMIGAATANPISFDMAGPFDYLVTGATNGRSLRQAGMFAMNKPCAAPTGISIAPNGSGSVTPTYTPDPACVPDAAHPWFGEMVAIDGVWQDALGVIHSGSAVPVPSGARTLSFRTMNAPDDYNIARNPGVASAPASVTVQ